MRDDVRAFLILSVPVIVVVAGLLMLAYNSLVGQFNKRIQELELTFQESIERKQNEKIAEASRMGFVQGKQSGLNELVQLALQKNCPVISVKDDTGVEVQVVNARCHFKK